MRSGMTSSRGLINSARISQKKMVQGVVEEDQAGVEEEHQVAEAMVVGHLLTGRQVLNIQEEAAAVEGPGRR